jgi:uncharacterized membrane protein YbaN (DUF454 family)
MSGIPDKKDAGVKRLRLRFRPLWQRFAYPFVGIILIILGIIGWLLPVVPGFPLIIIGLPLLFCFHPRLELRVRKLMQRLGHFLIKKIRKNRS